MKKRKRSKKTYSSGTKNNFEHKIYTQIAESGIPFTYESSSLTYVLHRRYIPDFVIDTIKGKVYIECKGYLRPEHKSKMVAVKQQHPELDIRILFYASNKKNIRWAEKNGFRWAVDVIPLEWFQGL